MNGSSAATQLPPANAPANAIEPLTFLARVSQAAVPPSSMPSLSFQLASAISQLGSYLRVRGDESLEHYYGAALALGCLAPAGRDMKAYGALLLTFLRYDRRAPMFSALVPAAEFQVDRAHTIHFIHMLPDQRAFQAIYLAAGQLDAYGSRAHSPRKIERMIFLAREISGRTLFAPLSAAEELYASLAAVA
jgi:hypothetical protein